MKKKLLIRSTPVLLLLISLLFFTGCTGENQELQGSRKASDHFGAVRQPGPLTECRYIYFSEGDMLLRYDIRQDKREQIFKAAGPVVFYSPSPDNKDVVIHLENSLFIYNIVEGSKKIIGTGRFVYAKWSGDNRMIAFLSADKRLFIHHVVKEKNTLIASGVVKSKNSFTFSHDYSKIYFTRGAGKNNILASKSPDGTRYSQLKFTGAYFTNIILSPDGSFLAYHDYRQLFILNLATGGIENYRFKQIPSGICWQEQGKIMYLFTDDFTSVKTNIYEYNGKSTTLINIHPGESSLNNILSGYDFCRSGKKIFYITGDKTENLWMYDRETGENKKIYTGNKQISRIQSASSFEEAVIVTGA